MYLTTFYWKYDQCQLENKNDLYLLKTLLYSSSPTSYPKIIIYELINKLICLIQ